jgi:hypothetical protein
MAASIKGKQVIFGVPAGVITATHSVTTSGIVQSFSVEPGGSTSTVEDEDDDIVTRIDHKAENKVTMEVVCLSNSVMPAKGAEITGSGLGTIDGVNFTTGRIFVDAPKAQYDKGGVKKISIAATHYPTMAADA